MGSIKPEPRMPVDKAVDPLALEPRPSERTARVADDLAATVERPSAPQDFLLDAAEIVISEVGFAAATEEEIARCAGISVDVVHAHFSSKKALLFALSERFYQHVVSATDAVTAKEVRGCSSPRAVIESGIRAILDVVFAREAIVRAIVASGNPTLLEASRRVGASMTTKVVRVLEEMRAEGGETIDRRDVAFAFLLAISLAHNAVMVGADWAGEHFDRDALYARVTRAVNAYLDGQPKPS